MRALTAVISMLIITTVSGCKKEEKYVKPLTLVKTAVVEGLKDSNELKYSASVVPSALLNMAFKSSGYVTGVLQVKGIDGRLRNAQDGDFVKKGTVLASIEQKTYREKAAQAKAQLTKAKAQLTKAMLDYERANNLFSTKSITKPQYDDAQAALGAAEADHTAAAAQLREAQIALDECSLIVPFDSVIFQRHIEDGSLVGPSVNAFTIADTSTVKVVFGVPDMIIGTFKNGDTVNVFIEALQSTPFKGQITRIAPFADDQSRVFNIEVQIPNSNQAIKAGMIASMHMESVAGVASAEITVPLNAIVRPSDNSTGNSTGFAVFVVEDQGGKLIARKHSVAIGRILANRVSIEKGLHRGEKVIVSGQNYVLDGEQVKLAD
ncbi:efflux RND transporter periplasmic adaptor subunit [Candidatus Magnetominusculus xianensis]|uniref:RND family efflux transporter MFP subunit n=1 Tax=Candidatus Magnetominusculus xianensis TaxID=1748249 RepID=A0ABR5SIW5_9BACT|nr:efflux RND transporter periplasmic adaptor subunit [Candidatus Magnetominusculus xianensis]KWT92919.1 putative RND family efflux transporter MFP subunit [Candidatus Magnetominusculus xianensis]MBF0402923.1 efflux RND transporter periplasmic adaptor subunit [Nitrospirota bacterium]